MPDPLAFYQQGRWYDSLQGAAYLDTEHCTLWRITGVLREGVAQIPLPHGFRRELLSFNPWDRSFSVVDREKTP